MSAISATSSAIERVLARLHGVKAAGFGRWMACCPVHGDRQQSLSIAVGDKRPVIFKCHAGCTYENIVAALGLEARDLYDEQPGRDHGNGRAQGVETRPRLVKTYDYVDADGALLFQSCRFEPKDFKQRHRVGDSWVWNVKGVEPVLYRLPELLEAVGLGKRIHIAEGEKDVDALIDRGFAATTNPMGAGKWRDEYSADVAGADVVILPDNDQPGRNHAAKVAASLTGIAARVTIVELPGLPAKGDVTKWIERGGTREQLEQLVQSAISKGSSPAEPLESDRTEVGNAATFARLHGSRVRYVPAWNRFLVWKGGRWQPDDQRVVVTEFGKDVGRLWLQKAAEAPSEKARNECIAWGRTSLTARAIHNLVELTRGIGGISIDHNTLDADPWLFCVKNGVIDLRTGALRPADPADLITRQAPIAFHPNATAERWDRAMAEWFPDADERDYVHRLVGAAMVGKQIDHIFVIHYGAGRNGKGTFVRALRKIFGDDYSVTPHISLFVQRKHDEHDTIKADLFRVRLAVASETERRVSLAEASIKNLTGDDAIRCRRLYENPWEFEPSHSLWLQTNHLPAINGRDTGVWSRVRVVKWVATFEGNAADTQLGDQLFAEREGILAWAVRGCMRWQADGLREPEIVIRETLAYRNAEDVFTRFMADVGLEFQKGQRIRSSVLRDLFAEWSQETGVDGRKHADLPAFFQENGASKDRERDEGTKRQVRVWLGVGIKTDGTCDRCDSSGQDFLKDTAHIEVLENGVTAVTDLFDGTQK
jgi:putative DNA primase/helicase